MKSFKFVLVTAVLMVSVFSAFAEIVIPAKRVSTPSLHVSGKEIVIPAKRATSPLLATIVIPIKPGVEQKIV